MKPDSHLSGGGYANRTASLPTAKASLPQAGPKSLGAHPASVHQSARNVLTGKTRSMG